MSYSYFLWLSEFNSRNVDCPLWDIYSLIFFLSGKLLLLMWVRNETFL